jgi:hypothetical protein
MASLPSDRRLADLCLDLQVERSKLSALVLSLANLQRDWHVPEAAEERSDAAALRLQSFYTGIERCFVQIVRVLNGGPPDGADWHRRLLERMGVSTELRPAMRHLYAYELERDQVLRLLQRALELWPAVDQQLKVFESWLMELSS